MRFWITCLAFVPFFVLATDSRNPEVKIFTDWGEEKQIFPVLDGAWPGGVKVAVGNVDGKGKEEIVIASQKERQPTVQVFKADGILISEFLAYAEDMQYGVNVAVGDLNNDGREEIITGAGEGGGAHVRVFNKKGEVKKFNQGFAAFADNFRGGVNVAVGDLDGDGQGEIIAAAGPGGQSHVRVFDRSGNYLGQDFWPFEEDYQGGVSVAVSNIDGGEDQELIFGKASFGLSEVKVYKRDGTLLGEWQVWGDEYKGGVNVAGGDVDQDGYDEIIVAVANIAGPQIRFFEYNGTEIKNNFFAYEGEFRGGLSIAAGNVRGSKKLEIITTPLKKRIQGRPDLYKYIEVDISEQQLWAYRGGLLIKTFLVSTGISSFPTPTGEFKVQGKLLKTRMTGFYGPDDPANYDLADVPHVLPFSGDYTLHGTYWHNNFGHRMSHGCINLPLDEAEWLYNWAGVGDVVWIHE